MWKQRTDRADDYILMDRGKMVSEGVRWFTAKGRVQ